MTRRFSSSSRSPKSPKLVEINNELSELDDEIMNLTQELESYEDYRDYVPKQRYSFNQSYSNTHFNNGTPTISKQYQPKSRYNIEEEHNSRFSQSQVGYKSNLRNKDESNKNYQKKDNYSESSSYSNPTKRSAFQSLHLEDLMSDSEIQELQERSTCSSDSSKRLYEQSVAAYEKRVNLHRFTAFSMDDGTEIEFPKKIPKVKNYKSPEKRITESIEHRKVFVQQYKEMEEAKFKQECTFHPKINKSQSYEGNNDNVKRTKNKDYVDDSKVIRWIDPNSERIAKHAKPRTPKKNNYSSDDDYESPPSKKFSSIKTQKQSVERLATPRKVFHKEEEEEYEVEHKSISKKAINRLVEESIKKEENENIPEYTFQPEINPKSKEIAARKSAHQTDLYKESIESRNKKIQKIKQAKKYKQLQEMTLCSFRPNYTAPAYSPRKALVKGMNDHIDRMSDSRSITSTSNDVYNSKIICHPTESHEARFRYVSESQINAILAEVEEKV